MPILGLLIDLGDTVLIEKDLRGKRDTMFEPEIVPGVDSALPLLAARYRLAIVRNSSTGREKNVDALRHVGLDQYFSAVVTSADIGIAKPDPRIFQVALKMLYLSACEVIVIGDQVETDIVGANRLGSKSILLRWREDYPANMSRPEARPTFLVRSWVDIPTTVEQIASTTDDSLGIGKGAEHGTAS